jgi:hypothetical protein
MKKKHFKIHFKLKLLLFGCIILLSNCQSEYDVLIESNKSKNFGKGKDYQSHLPAKDIRNIVNFVNTETNFTRQVLIGRSSIKKLKQDFRTTNLSARTNSETSFGYIDTSNALVVKSENVISYTFKVVSKEMTSFINYIVVEHKVSLEKYGYFMKYTPSNNWIQNKLPLSSFSGTIDYFNENEELQTTLTLLDGYIINFGNTEIPCPEIVFNPLGDNQDDENPDNSSGSYNGGSSGGSINNGEGSSYNYNPWESWWTGWIAIGGGGGGNETTNPEEIDDSDSGGGMCCSSCTAAPGIECNHEHHYYPWNNNQNRTGQINLKNEPTVHNPCVHTGVIAFLMSELEFTQEQIDCIADIENESFYQSMIKYLNTNNYNAVSIYNTHAVVNLLLEADCNSENLTDLFECIEQTGDLQSCLIEENKKKECRKISNLLDNNPTYLQKIQNIATNVSDNKEYSLSIHEDGSEYNEMGTVGSGGIEYPEYSSKYKFHIHTHDSHGENGQGTLSVYSIEDLIMYAKLAYYNKLDSGTFVAFLATNDGTKYALTINDKNKLIDLFYDRLEIPLTIENAVQYGANTVKLENLHKKYYDPKNPNRKLKVDSQSPNNDLIHFMNLLAEGNMGVSVFESTDNFQTFKNISLKNNNIEKTPCN